MDATSFREIIFKRYKDCMEDCQIPTGALSVLNPAEFFAFDQWEKNKRLEKELANLSISNTPTVDMPDVEYYTPVIRDDRDHVAMDIGHFITDMLKNGNRYSISMYIRSE